MRDYRCFVPGDWQEGEVVALPEEEAHHLAKVLRAGKGSRVLLLDGHGTEFEAELTRADRRGAEARLLSVSRSHSSPAPRWLACAPTKSSHFEDMLQRAVELGMTAFFPLHTDRSTVEYDARRASRKRERWQRLASGALKQCERLWLPEFHLPLPLCEHLALAREHGVRPLVLMERGGADAAALTAAELVPGGVCLYVGPEGGWSPGERGYLAGHAGPPFHLGTEAVLRTETAALAALSRLLGWEGAAAERG